MTPRAGVVHLCRCAVKRALDITVSLVLLAALAPLMAVIALAVLATSGRPVLFRQRRPGRHGVPFTLWKFRTMVEARDEEGKLRPDEERLSRFGGWLRSTSFDELPELCHVLSGRMSLVGPRPLLPEYLELYSPQQARRHEVRPGITGWAQIHGRNATSWAERLALDVWYVDHWSLTLDLRILLRTAVVVLRRYGISQPGHVTIEPFTGSHHE
jgi:sugar transferase EpsL